ncbi:MAG: hypothetical protein DIKNOCCD_03339 [bacterium]|nr:hypothetical protein [bacterium]
MRGNCGVGAELVASHQSAGEDEIPLIGGIVLVDRGDHSPPAIGDFPDCGPGGRMAGQPGANRFLGFDHAIDVQATIRVEGDGMFVQCALFMKRPYKVT